MLLLMGDFLLILIIVGIVALVPGQGALCDHCGKAVPYWSAWKSPLINFFANLARDFQGTWYMGKGHLIDCPHCAQKNVLTMSTRILDFVRIPVGLVICGVLFWHLGIFMQEYQSLVNAHRLLFGALFWMVFLAVMIFFDFLWWRYCTKLMHPQKMDQWFL